MTTITTSTITVLEAERRIHCIHLSNVRVVYVNNRIKCKR